MASGIRITREQLVCAALGVIAVLVVHDDYGATWDDPFHAKVGALALGYFRSGAEDLAIDRFDDAKFYGPLLEMIPALVRGAVGVIDRELLELRHLWNGLIALLVLPPLLALGRGLGVRGAATFAVLALAAQPRFTGEALINSKDAPFLVMVTWFQWSLTRLAVARAPEGREWILLGITWGAALWVRPGALPLLLVLALVAFAVRDFLRRGEPPSTGGRGSSRFLTGFLGAFAIAWVVMVIPWPSAHRDPLLHPLRTMGAAVRFYTEYPVLWEGTYRSSAELPRTYLPRMMLVTTPLAAIALCAIGVGFVLRRLRRRPRSRVALRGAIVLAWLAIPVGAAVVTRPNVYDGIRHFLFVLPAVAVLVGYGVSRLIHSCARRARIVTSLAVATMFVPSMVDQARLHPYSYAYFNEIVGGVSGASGRFETEYSVTAYRAAVERINERVASEPSRRFAVLVGGSESMLEGVSAFAAPNLQLRLARPDRRWPDRLPVDVDFYVGATRYRMATEPFAAEPIVHRVERDGAVFAVVRARDGIW